MGLSCGWWSFIAHGIGPAKDLKKSYGEWAVVTGSTDGIGKAMAKELSKTMKVLLVSRNPERLAETLKELHGSGHATCCIDFADFGPAKRETMKKAMEGKDIGVLVNNVGMSYDHPEYFHELDEDRVDKLTKLNIESTTWMTYMCLPKMVEKKKGAIVSTSSFTAILPCPLLAQYAGGKDYMVRFSESLAAEYGPKGIDVQAQVPMYVTSKISKFRHASLNIPNPETYAKAAVKAIGYETQISPYWPHYVQCGFVRIAPTWLLNMVVSSMHLGTRAKALKKKAERKAE